MNLGDLLDELRTGILHDVSKLIPGANSDQLWTDTRLVRYINQAHRRFARRTKCIRDATTPQCCQFKTNTTVNGANENLYVLDPSVLSVISVRMTGDTADLIKAGHDAFDTYHVPDGFFFNPDALSTMPPGKPLAFSTDEQIAQNDVGSTSVVTLRLFPIPTAAYANIVGNMRVVRLPLTHLTMANLDAIPEIPEDHHLDMLDWAAYLALRIVDTDAGAPTLAENFRQSFETKVQEAIEEAKEKMFTPLLWGFGRSGWSWSSF